MPTGWRSEYLCAKKQRGQHWITRAGLMSLVPESEGSAYLDVISKVVPKIWARTNSAMVGNARKGVVCGGSGSLVAVRGPGCARCALRGRKLEGELEMRGNNEVGSG